MNSLFALLLLAMSATAFAAPLPVTSRSFGLLPDGRETRLYTPTRRSRNQGLRAIVGL